MYITLECWISYGKLDTNDWECDFEVTVEEFARLKAVAQRLDEFCDAEDVKDLYKRFYDEMVKSSTEELLSNDEDLAEEYGDIEDWSADELYSFGINFPEWFYDEYAEEYDEEE